jgi:hypothetical protein
MRGKAMEDILRGILSSMEKERDYYEELNELSNRKTDIIIDKKIKDLETIVDLEERIIVNIGKLEADRQELVDRLAGIRDVDPESITLSSLIEFSDGDLKDRFQTLQNDFIRIIDREGVPNALKAQVLEYGKSGQKAKPWMKPARRKARKPAVQAMEETLKKELDL